MSRRVSIVILLTTLLALSLFTLVSADTLEQSAIGQAFINQPNPKHPVATVARTLFSERQARLAELQTQIDRCSDVERRFELEREVESVKLQTELQLLRIQLDHFRATGNTQAAAEMSEAVTRVEGLMARNEERRREFQQQ